MRHLAAKVNRGWLFVLGLLLVLAGLLGAGLSTGLVARLDQLIGLGVGWPAPGDMIVAEQGKALLDTQAAAVAVTIGGVLLVIAGLVWLGRQIPRRGLAKPFRLHDDAQAGLTRIGGGVIAEAVGRQIATFNGVGNAVAQLRGTARHPELTVKITADERADIAGIVTRIRERAVTDLQTALDVTIARLAVQVELDRAPRAGTSHITL